MARAYMCTTCAVYVKALRNKNQFNEVICPVVDNFMTSALYCSKILSFFRVDMY